MTENEKEHGTDDIRLDELLRWGEFGCWSALALAPVIYYINGASVSTDQAVVRAGVVIFAGVGAIALRLLNWRRSKSDVQ